jgi:hypothetical protein
MYSFQIHQELEQNLTFYFNTLDSEKLEMLKIYISRYKQIINSKNES